MEKSTDVSVVVLTYNSDYNKTILTIAQVLKQKNCNLEIIVADDGSKENHFDKLDEYFCDVKFQDYCLLGASENKGTVRNCYNAILTAKGKYVFCTSPGDFLHDECVLCDMYTYAEKHNSSSVFGNAVFYQMSEGTNVLKSINHPPYWPELYNGSSDFIKQAAFFYGNYVVGATFFRRKDDFIKYLEKIVPLCKFTEDNTTNAYMLFDNKNIHYFDRNVVFYEHGTGISTSKAQKWKSIIDSELNECYKLIEVDFPENKVIRICRKSQFDNDSSKNRFINCFKQSPKIAAVWVAMKLHAKRKTVNSSNELDSLNKIFNG